jgi:hypothetical protein
LLERLDHVGGARCRSHAFAASSGCPLLYLVSLLRGGVIEDWAPASVARRRYSSITPDPRPVAGRVAGRPQAPSARSARGDEAGFTEFYRRAGWSPALWPTPVDPLPNRPRRDGCSGGDPVAAAAWHA